MASIGALGRAQEQETARTQCEVKHLQNFTLHFAIQVDQQVAANDQVNLRKGRIGQQAVFGKQDLFANFLANPVVVIFLDEVMPQARRRHIGHDRLRVQTGPADADGALVNVGGEQLQRGFAGVQLQLIVEQHRQAVGFFAR